MGRWHTETESEEGRTEEVKAADRQSRYRMRNKAAADPATEVRAPVEPARNTWNPGDEERYYAAEEQQEAAQREADSKGGTNKQNTCAKKT